MNAQSPTGSSVPPFAYRPDIDGLRALAIVAVLLYHAEVTFFAGGFVGVDVFFVISGFLITSLIRSELGAGRFSLLLFYERRIRRIFPALFLMLAAVTVLAVGVLFPSDLENYAGSLIATTGFASNFYFWDRSGYFDPAANTNALLHTWSLAVEEQFYLVFPPLALWLARKGRRHQVFIIGALLAASLGASIWAVREAPLSAFYLLPFRMWELLIGATLAIWTLSPPSNRLAREGLAATGLFLVVGSTFVLTRDMFPGEKALAPCVGAALLIFCNVDGRTAVARVLSARPFVMVGLISYSLYLWHWPLLVIARYWTLRSLTPLETTAVLAASVILAALSWTYVERPFRARERIGRPVVARSAIAAIGLAAAVGAIQIYGQGFPERYSPDIRALLVASSDRDPELSRCFDPEPADVQMKRLCHIGAGATAMPSVLVWGDSHADALLPAVDTALREKNLTGYMAGHGSCLPIVGLASSRSIICGAFNDEVLRLAIQEPAIRDIILIANWANYTEGFTYGDPSDTLVLSDGTSNAGSLEQNKAIFAQGLEKTVAVLVGSGKRVLIVAGVPEVGVPVPEALARVRVASVEQDIRPTLEAYLARQAFANSVFESLRAKFGITVLHPHEALCDESACDVMRDGRPIYRDGHHLSAFGARTLIPLFRNAL